MSNQTEKVFGEGVFFKDIETQFGTLTKVSFKVEDFTKFLNQHKNADGWVTIMKKTSANGKTYAELDTFVPKKQVAATDTAPIHEGNDDLPF